MTCPCNVEGSFPGGRECTSTLRILDWALHSHGSLGGEEVMEAEEAEEVAEADSAF